MKRPVRNISLWARIVCVLSLILIGFAHQPPQFYPTVPVTEYAAYMLPDGSVPFLCDENGSGNGHDPFMDHRRCEACLISASTLVPPPPTLAVPPMRVAEHLLPATIATGPALVFRLTSAPRGPPSFFLA